MAAAAGPAGNVAAEAINVVVNPSIDARLRGFPENPEPRVLNPEPTAGGVDATGPEITQEDVDTAVAALREDLAAQVAQAIGTADPDMIVVEAPRGEPTIQLPEGLAGMRDEERVEISGELAWEVVRADPTSVMDEARALLEADASRIPDGHELLDESVDVRLGTASLSEGVLTIPVSVTARTIGRIDLDEVRSRIAGRSEGEAAAALADLGTVSVDLWPGWAATIPQLEWRVEILIEEQSESGS